MPTLNGKYSDIIVERRGKDSSKQREAFMITEGIMMEVFRGETYAMVVNPKTATPEIQKRMVPVGGKVKQRTAISPEVCPQFLELPCKWDVERVIQHQEETNIFGKNSMLLVDRDVVTVPISATTPENLACFGAELITPADTFAFDIPPLRDCLPLSKMRVGKDYVGGFIMRDAEDVVGGSDETCFSGVYLERHDVPHFHMPLNDSTRGCLMLGKIEKCGDGDGDGDGKKLQLCAFNIAYGTAVYTHPWTLHNDCFLVGEFAVVYASTENFHTGTVLSKGKGGLYKPAVFEFV